MARNTFLLETHYGRVVHNATAAYGARLLHASGERMTTVCGVRAEPVKQSKRKRCKRCFEEVDRG